MSRHAGSTKGKRKNGSHRRGSQPPQSVLQTFQLFLFYVLDLLICLYMVLILVVQPFYNRNGLARIGTDKAYFLRQCIMRIGPIVLPVLASYLLISAAAFVKQNGIRAVKGWRPRWSVTDWFALCYGGSVVLSYLCSRYRSQAFLGHEKWCMGFFTQITMVIVYFLISRAWQKRDYIVLSILPVSAVVFLLGILNRFGIYPIDMKLQNSFYISTIGNINWYCGYLVIVFFAGLALFWLTDCQKLWKKALLGMYVAAGSAALVTQGSTSGILALGAVLLVMFRLSAKDGRRMQMFWKSATILSGVCLLLSVIQSLGMAKMNLAENIIVVFTTGALPIVMTIVSVIGLAGVQSACRRQKYSAAVLQKLAKALNGMVICLIFAGIVLIAVNTAEGGSISARLGLPENNLLTFNNYWGSHRGTTLKAGVQCFLEQDFLHKLVGVGPDAMAAFLYTHGSEQLVAMVTSQFGGNTLTNAHNEWLTILVDMGLFGCVSYIGLMSTAIVRFLREREKSLIAGACGLGILAYTVNNLVSFQQAMNLPTMFILLGVGENYLRSATKGLDQKKG